MRVMKMKMIFQAVEVVTFHDDAEQLAEKIAAILPNSYVRIYEYETEGNAVVRRDELKVIRPAK
jgi:hypothetical protein